MSNMGDVRNVNATADGVVISGAMYGVAREERRIQVGGPMEEYVDPFLDDEEIVACGIENPEVCESCT